MKMADLPSRIVHPLDMKPGMKVARARSTNVKGQQDLMQYMPATAKEITERAGLTYSAVKRRLLTMERKGIINHSGGRNNMVYRIGEKANE